MVVSTSRCSPASGARRAAARRARAISSSSDRIWKTKHAPPPRPGCASTASSWANARRRLCVLPPLAHGSTAGKPGQACTCGRMRSRRACRDRGRRNRRPHPGPGPAGAGRAPRDRGAGSGAGGHRRGRAARPQCDPHPAWAGAGGGAGAGGLRSGLCRGQGRTDGRAAPEHVPGRGGRRSAGAPPICSCIGATFRPFCSPPCRTGKPASFAWAPGSSASTAAG